MDDDDFHARLIEQLGGVPVLADQLGVARYVVYRWRNRGIPSRLWHHVIALAATAGIAVTGDELEATRPQGRVQI